jgi:hypothetical protein
LNAGGSMEYARSSEMVKDLSLLVHVGRGSGCVPSEVSLTVTYLTEAQNLICAGTLRSAMTVMSQIQVFNVAIRPFTQLDFFRWRNQPGIRGEQQGKRLQCMNIDGTSDVGDTDRQRAGWMRLSIGVIPDAGGVAVSELLFRFVP